MTNFIDCFRKTDNCWREEPFLHGSDLAHSSTSNQSSQFAVWDYPLGDKFTNMWEKIQATGVLNSSSEGVDKVLQGNFAFIHSSPVLKYYASQHCDLTVVGEQFSTKPYAFALQENSPLVSRINKEYAPHCYVF